MTAGERLQSYRKQHNLSQEDLAKQLFVTRQTISLWETDQTLPTIDNLIRLKDILGVSIDDILTEPQKNSEKDNKPLESYELKYTKLILKSVFKTVNLKSFLIYLLLFILLFFNTIRTFFVVTDNISKGIYLGLSFIATVLFIRYIISLVKIWKSTYENVFNSIFHYDIFEKCIKLTITKNGKEFITKTIIPQSISKFWSTKSLYIFIHQNSVYTLKKQCLDSNSRLHLFFHKTNRIQKKNIISGIIIGLLFVFSVAMSFNQSDGNITITQSIDGEETVTISESKYISKIENTLNIEIPHSSVITNVKTLTDDNGLYKDDICYNVIMLNISDYDAYQFEKSIKTDDRWHTILSQKFDDILPRNCQSIETDYHLFYNATDDTFNTLIHTGGTYKILYLNYDKEEKCITIIDYIFVYYPESIILHISSADYRENWYLDDSFMQNVGLSGCSYKSFIEGNVESTDFKSSVYILGHNRFGTLYEEFYLAIENENKIRFYDLDEAGYGCQLSLADLDGDNIDEIIINFHVAESGGAGGYNSKVIKVNEYSIYEIFNNFNNVDEVYNGFTSVLKNDFKIEISNVFTGYKTTIDYKHNIPDSPFAHWDENGKVIGEADNDYLLYDSFRAFYPEDVDNDGIYELICQQYTSLYGHADYIGDTKAVLKYNQKHRRFEVIDAEFIPYKE